MPSFAADDVSISLNLVNNDFKLNSLYIGEGQVTANEVAQKYKTVTIKVLSMDNERLVNVDQVDTDGNGDYRFQFKLPESARVGDYKIEVSALSKKETLDFTVVTGSNSSSNTSDKRDKSKNNSDEEEVEEIIINVPQNGEKKDNKKALSMGLEIMKDPKKHYSKETKADVIRQMTEIAGEELEDENQSVSAKREAIDQVVTAFDAYLEDDQVTFDDAMETMEHILKNTFKIENASKEVDSLGVLKTRNLDFIIEKTMEKATPEGMKLITKDPKNPGEFVLNQDNLKLTQKIVETKAKQFEATLNELGAGSAKVSRAVYVNMDSILDESLNINISSTNAQYLVENDTNMVINISDMSLTLDTQVLKKMSGDIQFSKEIIEDSQENKTASSTKGHKLKPVGSIYDLNITVDKNKINFDKFKPKFTFKLDELDIQDEDKELLSVYVQNEESGDWEIVRSRVEGLTITFETEHFSKYVVMKYEDQFEDCKEHWAGNIVQEAAAKGLVSGRSTEVFAPDASITRAEFVTMLINELGLEEEKISSFDDVSLNSWYSNVIANAQNISILDVNVGDFRPEEDITREEIAIMVAKLIEYKLGEEIAISQDKFIDQNELSDDGAIAIGKCREMNIINGYPDGSYKPQETATRAEAVTILLSISEY